MDYFNYNSFPINNNPNLLPPPNVPIVASPYPFDPRYAAMQVPPLRPHQEENKSDDELWVEAWLSKLGKITINLDSTIQIIAKPQSSALKHVHKVLKPSIHIAQKVLIRCSTVIDKLKTAETHLRENVDDMLSDEWKERTVEIGCLKDELTALLTQFEGTNALNPLKKNLNRRKRKRLAQKRRKLERKAAVAALNDEKALKHKQIDEWLESMKDSVERAKAEEQFKKDADCVLSEVTKKKSDARKHLALLASLIKLRSIREEEALKKGKELSNDDTVTFANITERLTKMWENCLRVYGIEENGLKVMLEQTVSEDIRASKLAKEKKLITDWEHVFYGPKATPSLAYLPLVSADRDLETFVAIRKSWDTFLTTAKDSQGSKIPIGWVLPAQNCRDDWAKYLNL